MRVLCPNWVHSYPTRGWDTKHWLGFPLCVLLVCWFLLSHPIFLLTLPVFATSTQLLSDCVVFQFSFKASLKRQMIVLDDEIYNDKQDKTNVYLGVCFMWNKTLTVCSRSQKSPPTWRRTEKFPMPRIYLRRRVCQPTPQSHGTDPGAVYQTFPPRRRSSFRREIARGAMSCMEGVWTRRTSPTGIAWRWDWKTKFSAKFATWSLQQPKHCEAASWVLSGTFSLCLHLC